MPKNKFSLTDALQKKLLPAVSFESINEVLPVAEAFLKGGLNMLEIPLRTTVGVSAITKIRTAFPAMYVGAGTILSVAQLQQAVDAGAQFCLSPGFNKTVWKEAKKRKIPFIPGVMTPSEIERAYEEGFTVQKLFPVEQIGGVSFLKAMQGPYASLNLGFIPMGGVNKTNLAAYTSLKNVLAAGGSWLAPKELIEAKNFKAIEKNVQQALQITKQ